VKRRQRETFVVGAERLSDDAELDLRYEAEPDHALDELDQAAPAEPSIAPMEPAASSAGAGSMREVSGQAVRRSRRPFPPIVRTCGVVALSALVGAVLYTARRSDPSGGEPPGRVVAAGGEAEPAAGLAVDEPVSSRGQEAGNRRSRPDLPTASDHSRLRSGGFASSDQETVTDTVAAARQTAESPTPTGSPAAPLESGSTDQVAAPVRSAASVRQEFGP
jgi:hypothetical protein